MARKPGWMPRDNGLIILALVTVIVVVAAVVALAVMGRIEPETAIAALSGPAAVGNTAVGRLSGANVPADQKAEDTP